MKAIIEKVELRNNDLACKVTLDLPTSSITPGYEGDEIEFEPDGKYSIAKDVWNEYVDFCEIEGNEHIEFGDWIYGK